MSAHHERDPLDDLVASLRETPAVDDTTVDAGWRDLQKKIATGVVLVGAATLATEAARSSAWTFKGLLASIFGTTAGKAGLAVVAATIAVSTVVVTAPAPPRHTSQGDARPSTTAPVKSAEAVEGAPSPAEGAEVPSEVEVAPRARPQLPVAPTKPSVSSSASAPLRPAPASADRVREALVQLDRARAALEAEDGIGALAALDAYREAPVDGLDDDAEGLTVLATLLADPPLGARQGATFLRRHPDSPFAPSIRRALDARPRAPRDPP